MGSMKAGSRMGRERSLALLALAIRDSVAGEGRVLESRSM
jgi:hypothetical protein